MNRKKLYLILGIIGVIGSVFLIRSTIAYFQSQAGVINNLTAGKYGMTVQRSWESTTWEPGETKVPEKLNVKNDGDVDMAIRATVTEQFFNSSGTEIQDIDGLVDKVIDTNNWYYRNGYYYYKNILSGGQTTEDIITSITFSPDIENDSECHEDPNDSTRVICGNTGLGFEDSTYKLIINFDTIQASGAEDAWNIDMSVIAENSSSTVTIDLGNGNTITKDVKNYDTIGSLNLGNNIPTGYHLDHFEDEDGNEISSDTVITKELTIIPVFEANTYTISIDTDNDGEPDVEIEATYDSTYGSLPAPTNIPTGYHFDGYYNENNIKITEGDTVNIASNQTLTPRFIANTYTLTLNAAGGSVSDSTYDVTYDSTYGDLPTPVRDGYTFDGWYIEEDDGEPEGVANLNNGRIKVNFLQDVENNAKTTKLTKTYTRITRDMVVKITSDITIVAHWIANTNTPYTVNHYKQNLNDNEYTLEETDNLTGTTGTEVTPSRKEYTGFTEPSTQTVTVNGNGNTIVNYYYTRNSYTLTVNSGTGISSTSGAGSYKYGADVTITYNVATGYTFSSITGDKTTATFKMPASNVEVTVNATANSYTVTLDPGTGSVSPTSKSVTYNAAYGTLPDASKTGYDFDGWFIGSNEITSSSTVTTADNHTLTAHYTPQTATVTLHNDDSTSTIDVEYDATYGEAGLTTPTKTGYTFVNWNTNSNGTGDSIQPGTTVSDLTITELYAYYIPNTDTAYTVRHYQQKIGGDAATHNTTNYDLIETDANTTGTTGESITPATKNYTGFDSPSTQTTTIAADGSTLIEYYYTRNSYNLTVTLGTGVSSTNAAATYEYGATVNITPTYNTGYEFDRVTGDKDSLTFTMPASNTSITINGKASTYTVTANAGENATIPATSGWTLANDAHTATKSVTYNAAYGTLPRPTQSGYHFVNWYKESQLTNVINSESIVDTASNHTIYAKILVNTGTLSYDANGGTAINSTSTITHGSTYGTAISGVTPTWTGHTFNGWFTATSGGTQRKSTDTVSLATNNATETVHAQWTTKTYEVTLSGSNATIPANPTITYGSYVDISVTPSTGYYLSAASCDGDYTLTNTSGGAISTGESATGAQTIRIRNNSKDNAATCTFTTAKRSFTVNITKGGTTTSVDSISVPYNGNNTFTVSPGTGYYLSTLTCPQGYSCSGTTGTSATSEQTVTVTNNSTVGGGTITLARTARSFTANFSAGTGYTNPGNQTVSYGGSTQFNLTISDGYKLSSVTCDNDGYGVSYSANATGTTEVTIANNSATADTNCTITTAATYNSNIKSAYVYDETVVDAGVKNENGAYTTPPTYKCVTGNESTCVASSCMNSKTAGSCPVGTIVNFKVNGNITVRFHVLKDNGSTILMQSQENTVNGVKWYYYSFSNFNSNGPQVIVPELENATNGWSNVNVLNTVYFTDTGMKYDADYTVTPAKYKLTYSVGYSKYTRSNNRARLISVKELLSSDIGGCTLGSATCRLFLKNFLSNSIAYGGTNNDLGTYGSTGNKANWGYWTSTARKDGANSTAWYVDKIGTIYALDADAEYCGARAVVEINK